LAVDFHTDDRLARGQDGSNNLLNLVRNLRHRLANRPSNVAGNRNSADLRESVIDESVAAIWGEECKADWGRIVNELQL
jgi:hypothetical protein